MLQTVNNALIRCYMLFLTSYKINCSKWSKN